MYQRARIPMVAMGALLLWVLSPTLALAGTAWVFISEPDTDIQYASLSDSGFIPATNPASYAGIFGSGTTPAPGVATAIRNEAIGVRGAVDMTFEYSDATPLAVGTSQTVNFNFYDGTPSSTTPLSDTLLITFTGVSNGGNTSVGLHWRSDSADEIPPVTLPNAHNLNEIPFANGSTDLFSFINTDTGLSGTHVLVNSVVPEPSSVVMLGLGALGLGGLVLRRRRNG